jgi:hypothetical protein
VAIQTDYKSYDIWTLFVDALITILLSRKNSNLSPNTILPDLSEFRWIQWLNAGLAIFPSDAGLLYLRGLSYIALEDFPCAHRLLNESFSSYYQSESENFRNLVQNGVLQQNLDWVFANLPMNDQSTVPEKMFYPAQMEESCFPLRRFSSIGRNPIHEAALADAVEVLGAEAVARDLTDTAIHCRQGEAIALIYCCNMFRTFFYRPSQLCGGASRLCRPPRVRKIPVDSSGRGG